MVVGARSVEEILRGLPATRGRGSKASVALPADFAERGLRLKTHAFSDDYRFLSQEEARTKFANRDHPKAGLFVKQLPFGETGQGDIWCIRAVADRSAVTFLDHNDAVRAVPRAIGITFYQWLTLADLSQQIEAAIQQDPTLLDTRYRLKPRYRAMVNAVLNEISRGLSKRLPMPY